ncbi:MULTISPECIES: hypothetical protein [unclassified Microbacterium]|uniref:hypothetical protein n=1 Tax=unclassified Microbacterium TaxID=2609290 RepID=UPI003437B728
MGTGAISFLLFFPAFVVLVMITAGLLRLVVGLVIETVTSENRQRRIRTYVRKHHRENWPL